MVENGSVPGENDNYVLIPFDPLKLIEDINVTLKNEGEYSPLNATSGFFFGDWYMSAYQLESIRELKEKLEYLLGSDYDIYLDGNEDGTGSDNEYILAYYAWYQRIYTCNKNRT